MHERAERLPGSLVTPADDLAREFDLRLAESATLAFRVAFSVLRHREDAEDVAQDAYIRAHRGFRHLRDRERFRAWLVRLVWRLALDRQRANRRRGAREIGDDASLEICAPTVPVGDDAARLWAAIDRLPEKLRVTIVLASIEGHDVREVARLLRVPEGTVKSRLFLARQQLKEALR